MKSYTINKLSNNNNDTNLLSIRNEAQEIRGLIALLNNSIDNIYIKAGNVKNIKNEVEK